MVRSGEGDRRFGALCETQLALLSQGLGALWSVVYGWEQEGNVSQWVPLAHYPPQGEVLAWGEMEEVRRSLVPGDPRLVLPLMLGDRVVGVLVTVRPDRPWGVEEMGQIRLIAQTLAIAWGLEEERHWYGLHWQEERQDRWREQERLRDLLHQLRNPLTALHTFGKLLLKRLAGEERQRVLVERMLQQGDRLQGLLRHFEMEDIRADGVAESLPSSPTSHFLLPSAIGSEGLEADQVAAVLLPLLHTAQAIAAEKDIDLGWGGTWRSLRCTAEGLTEVISNLLDNAVKYTPSGGRIAVRLDVTDGQRPGMGGIAIADTGYGIPPQDQDRIFERHYRGIQAQGDIPGTGLGLGIGRDLVTAMGGEITVISPNGNSSTYPGSTFTLWLPLGDR